MSSYAFDQAKTEALSALKGALGKTYAPTLSEIEIPRDLAFGDFTFPVFRLAKGMKRDPLELARELAAKIAPTALINSATAEGSYVNFHLNAVKLFALAHKQVALLKDRYGEHKHVHRTVMIEYSGLNTHKPVHIGHLRNIVLGACLTRLTRASGVRVVAADFVNDLGLHVAQWLWCYQKFHAKEKPGVDVGDFMMRLYVEAVRELEAHPEYDVEVREILKKLESGESTTRRLWKKTRQWSLKEFARVHQELNAKFDVFYTESDFVNERRKVVDRLVAAGIAKLSQGAIIVDLEPEKLGVFLILRSDGTALYATTDLPLAVRKFRDYKLDASLYVVDVRQKLHFAQLFATLKRMGYTQEFTHVAYEFVTLPEGAMASRKGTIIRYDNFWAEMYKRTSQETQTRHPDWSQKKIAGVARAIARGALQFDMLKQDTERPIVFKMEEALSLEGFAAPYLQYTTARISGILRKTKPAPKGTRFSEHLPDIERRLTLALVRYPDVIRTVAAANEPSLLAHFLFETAQDFASFYGSVSVHDAPDCERALHLALLNDIGTMFQNGMALLGIESLEEM